MGTKDEEGNSVGGLISLVILIVIGIWVYNSFIKQETWQIMYEIPSDNTIHASGNYANREQCLESISSLRSSVTNSYNHECGSNCEPPATTIGVYTCKETASL